MLTFQSKTYGNNNKRVVFLLAGWGMTMWQMELFARLLAWHGYHCIAYVYDRRILSPDIETTRETLLRVKSDILQKMSLLKAAGHTTFYLFGTSLGSLLALMIANSSPDVSKIILNLVGSDLAETVWTWDTVNSGFKAELLQKNISLPQLKTAWHMLSPISNVDALQDKQILLYLALQDEVIPQEQPLRLLKKLEEQHYQYTVITNARLNHILAAAFNLLNARVYLDFLGK